jgi:hypothetical protein
MPDSRIVLIHKKIAELIGVDFAAGYSGIDFTGRVIRGIETNPIMVPHACVRFVDSLEEVGPTMGRYQGKAIFEIYAFVAGATLSARCDGALNVCSDMIKAITDNRQLSLGSSVDDVICDFMALEGSSFGVEGTGIGYIKISVKYRSDDGS